MMKDAKREVFLKKMDHSYDPAVFFRRCGQMKTLRRIKDSALQLHLFPVFFPCSSSFGHFMLIIVQFVYFIFPIP